MLCERSCFAHKVFLCKDNFVSSRWDFFEVFFLFSPNGTDFDKDFAERTQGKG